MQKRRATGFTVIETLVTLFFVVLICGIVFDYDTSSEYCQICGRKRTGRSIGIFSHPLRWSYTEKHSAFSQLYTEFVSSSCAHKWRRSTHGYINLFGGGVGCDTRYRRIFMEDQRLKQLQKLKDKNKIRIIVANCNVPDSSWPGDKLPNARGKNAFNAFDELATIKTQQQENEWWRKNRHLFVPKK